MNINFYAQFIEPIKTSVKTSTIRRHKKPLAQIGKTLHMFVGMRTKNCMKIGTAILADVQLTRLIILPKKQIRVILDESEVVGQQLAQVIKQDGFENSQEMAGFFNIVARKNARTRKQNPVFADEEIIIDGYRYCWSNFQETFSELKSP